MKSFFQVIILLFVCIINAAAQKDKQPKLLKLDNEKMKREIDSSMKQLDSINARINNSYQLTMDSINRSMEAKRNQRSLESFMQMQKEQQEKQKRSNWIRVGIGILFFGVLVFGWMRKKKKATNT